MLAKRLWGTENFPVTLDPDYLAKRKEIADNAQREAQKKTDTKTQKEEEPSRSFEKNSMKYLWLLMFILGITLALLFILKKKVILKKKG